MKKFDFYTSRVHNKKNLCYKHSRPVQRNVIHMKWAATPANAIADGKWITRYLSTYCSMNRSNVIGHFWILICKTKWINHDDKAMNCSSMNRHFSEEKIRRCGLIVDSAVIVGMRKSFPISLHRCYLDTSRSGYGFRLKWLNFPLSGALTKCNIYEFAKDIERTHKSQFAQLTLHLPTTTILHAFMCLRNKMKGIMIKIYIIEKNHPEIWGHKAQQFMVIGWMYQFDKSVSKKKKICVFEHAFVHARMSLRPHLSKINLVCCFEH